MAVQLTIHTSQFRDTASFTRRRFATEIDCQVRPASLLFLSTERSLVACAQRVSSQQSSKQTQVLPVGLVADEDTE